MRKLAWCLIHKIEDYQFRDLARRLIREILDVKKAGILGTEMAVLRDLRILDIFIPLNYCQAPQAVVAGLTAILECAEKASFGRNSGIFQKVSAGILAQFRSFAGYVDDNSKKVSAGIPVFQGVF